MAYKRSLRQLAFFLLIVGVPGLFLYQLRQSWESAGLSVLSNTPASVHQRRPRPKEPKLINHDADSGKGGAAAPPTVADRIATQHQFAKNGLLIPNPKGQHPIYDLLFRGQDEWSRKMEKASKNLQQAVTEYRRRYGRHPPKGFDRWWKWASENDVLLPDEYDQIMDDLEPFFAIHPRDFNDLRRKAAARINTFTLKCPGRAWRKGWSSQCTYKIQDKDLAEDFRKFGHERARQQISVVEEIQDLLEDVEVVYYFQDVPVQFVAHEFKESLKEAASLGEYYDPEEAGEIFEKKHIGWPSICSQTSPLRNQGTPDPVTKKINLTEPVLEDLWNGNKSFVWDHKATMDPCQHPNLVYLNGFLSSHGKGPASEGELLPLLTMSKTFLHSDILAVVEENWTEDVGHDPEWEDKKDNHLLWRGKTTGIYWKEKVPWNISQRANLLQHANRKDGVVPVLDVTKRTAPVGLPKNQSYTELSKKYMDVAFVDEPIQCDEPICSHLKKDYRFGERKTFQEANAYKYQLDVDGNGWSARFKRLMSTNSLIFKSTIFPEWFTDRVQPWVHYIPLKADLTDMYDVMSFFQEHDSLARDIAIAGKQWSRTFWRREDMTSYQFRLYLELSRLMAGDREKASYIPGREDLEDEVEDE